jgi:hypothetical protein
MFVPKHKIILLCFRDPSGSEWLPKEMLETKMVEKLNDSQVHILFAL